MRLMMFVLSFCAICVAQSIESDIRMIAQDSHEEHVEKEIQQQKQLWERERQIKDSISQQSNEQMARAIADLIIYAQEHAKQQPSYTPNEQLTNNPYDKKVAKIVWFSIAIAGGSLLMGSALYTHTSEMGIAGTIATGVSIPFLVSGIKATAKYHRWEKEHN